MRSWLASWLVSWLASSVWCKDRLAAGPKLATVADFSRFGTDKDCRGGVGEELDGGVGWRASERSPAPELAKGGDTGN